MITEYHLYSDERRSPCKRFFDLGGLVCTDRGAARLLGALQRLRSLHGLGREMKWGNVSSRHASAYREWVDVFFEDPHARFSLLRIEQNRQWREFHRDLERNRTYDDAIASAFH